MKRTIVQSALTITAIALLLVTVGCGGGNRTYDRALDAAKASPRGAYTQNPNGTYSPSNDFYFALVAIAAATAGCWAVVGTRKLKAAK
ncbi:MAG: hypothetical protein AAF609_27150 [Cyanobacteria bacterium P01_C01_bin.120]